MYCYVRISIWEMDHEIHVVISIGGEKSVWDMLN